MHENGGIYGGISIAVHIVSLVKSKYYEASLVDPVGGGTSTIHQRADERI